MQYKVFKVSNKVWKKGLDAKKVIKQETFLVFRVSFVFVNHYKEKNPQTGSIGLKISTDSIKEA